MGCEVPPALHIYRLRFSTLSRKKGHDAMVEKDGEARNGLPGVSSDQGGTRPRTCQAVERLIHEW